MVLMVRPPGRARIALPMIVGAAAAFLGCGFTSCLGLWKIFGLDLWSMEDSVFLFLFSMEDSKTRNFGVSSLCGGDPSKHSKGVGNCSREGRRGNDGSFMRGPPLWAAGV